MSKAEMRAFYDLYPCNAGHSTQPEGTLAYSQEVTCRKYFVEPHIPEFAQFERWAGEKVLELGCGIGTDTISFAEHGAQVTAVDLSSRSLEIAHSRVKALGLNNAVTLVHGDMGDLASCVSPEPYSLVYSFGALHHTANPWQVVYDIRQNYMRRGSLFKVMLYNRYSWKVLHVLLTRGWRFWAEDLDTAFARQSEARAHCPISRTFTRASARAVFQDLEILSMRLEHIFPYRVSDYVAHRYIKEWYWRWIPSYLFRFLERHIGAHLLVTAQANL